MHFIGQNPGQKVPSIPISTDTQKSSSLHPTEFVSPSHNISPSAQVTLHVTEHVAPVESFVGPIYIIGHVIKTFKLLRKYYINGFRL